MKLRTSTALAASVLMAIGLLEVGCGADDRRTPEEASVALADFPEAYTAAACDFAFRCCAESERARILTSGAEPDLATCLAVQGAQAMAFPPDSDEYDPQAGGDCIAEIRALPCGTIFEVDRMPACRAAHNRPSEGGGAGIGQACTYDPGFTGDSCAQGGFCDLDSSTCAARRSVAAACEETRECQRDLVCEPGSGLCTYENNGPGCTGG